MKKISIIPTLLLMLAILTPLNASAYDFVMNNIYYIITGDNTVSVTYKDTNLNSYSGTVNIPATVTHDGVQYNVTAIGSSAFRSCPNLTKVVMNYGIQKIGYAAFYNCPALTSVNIPNSVTTLDSFAFRECTSLTSIEIPNSVTTINSQVFQNCTSLRNVTLPNGISIISAGMFWGCSALESIVIPNTVTAIYTYAFADCTSLLDITFSDSTYDIDADAFVNTAWFDAQPDGIIYAGKVAFAFVGIMPEHYHITFKPGTIAIGTSAFYDMGRVEAITIPASVIHLGSLFIGSCYNLESIVVESGNPVFDSRDNCNAVIETATNKLVAGCMNTVIPNSVTAIGQQAFYRCDNLPSINLHNAITSIDNEAFYGCKTLKRVSIPASVNHIGTGVFSYCYNITSIKVASDNTTYDSRDNCNAIIETATNKLISGCCTSFPPNGITTIDRYAFYSHQRLEKIKIPASVTAIDSYAFHNNPYLKTIYCEATTPPAITGSTFYYGSYEQGVLYVPRASIEAYQNTELWEVFVDIRAIEDIKFGDTNNDGRVSISDVTLIIDYLLSFNPNLLNPYIADFNRDGKVTISDVTSMIDYLLTSN